MARRMIYHRAKSRISVGVDINDLGRVTATIAACNPRDSFTKKAANKIIHARLDKMRRSVYILGNYSGTTPTEDIMRPIMDIFRDISPRRNVNLLTRQLSEITV